jgi:16S rRNA (cytosine1402-N4)-methyltransferase
MTDPLRYATRYHAPVLLQPVLDGLVTDPAGTYLDGTLGGGGHTAALLERLAPEGRVLSIDQDDDAIAEASARLAPAIDAGRLTILKGNFGDMEALLSGTGVDRLDGILLDLGISSHQIDRPERGFAYSAAGPLDMRMDPSGGQTAADMVNTLEPETLMRILRAFGEEPRAPRIVREIVARRPLETTAALADAVRAAVPFREEVKSLSRVFQALRIAVNDELRVLERALAQGLRLLRTGGRMAVIAYHSLEDRRVKVFFRYGNFEDEPVHDFYGNLLTPWELITRKPIAPSDEEIAANPRARSARLRIAEKKNGSS